MVLATQSVSSISVTPSSGNDLLVMDYSNGDPVPAGGINFTGAGVSLGNTLQVVGASPTDAFVLASGQVQHGTGTVNYGNVLNLTVSTGNATAISDLQLLGVTVGSQASLTAVPIEHIGQLTVSSGATATLHALFGAAIVNGTLQFSPDGSDAGTSSLSNLLLAGSTDNWSGRVDLANNKWVVETTAGNKSAMLAKLRDAVAYGTTHNTGILSTDLPANTVLAVMDAATTGLTSFGGVAIDSNSILIGPELPGDANIDGVVDLTDLSVILNNFGSVTVSWTSGNFDNDSAVDLTDLSAVLNNFGGRASSSADVPTGAGGVTHGVTTELLSVAATASTLGVVKAGTGPAGATSSGRLPRIGMHGSVWAHDMVRTVQVRDALKLASTAD